MLADIEGFIKKDVYRAHIERKSYNQIGGPRKVNFKDFSRINFIDMCKTMMSDVGLEENNFGVEAPRSLLWHRKF